MKEGIYGIDNIHTAFEDPMKKQCEDCGKWLGSYHNKKGEVVLRECDCKRPKKISRKAKSVGAGPAFDSDSG